MVKYFISHRGNTYGPNSEKENQPTYIEEAINMGFDVEIDVWKIKGKLFLGHDEPTYEITKDFLFDNKDVLWCHAKNAKALFYLIENKHELQSFSHNIDSHVITSSGNIWAYIGKEINKNTICVMPESAEVAYNNDDLAKCLGICSDYIQEYYNVFHSGYETGCILQ